METTLNISANLRAVDSIKSEILSETAKLFRQLSEYCDSCDKTEVAEEIATIVATSYILARRMGIEPADIDGKIKELLSIAIEQNHELEISFSDMTAIKRHIRAYHG